MLAKFLQQQLISPSCMFAQVVHSSHAQALISLTELQHFLRYGQEHPTFNQRFRKHHNANEHKTALHKCKFWLYVYPDQISNPAFHNLTSEMFWTVKQKFMSLETSCVCTKGNSSVPLSNAELPLENTRSF